MTITGIVPRPHAFKSSTKTAHYGRVGIGKGHADGFSGFVCFRVRTQAIINYGVGIGNYTRDPVGGWWAGKSPGTTSVDFKMYMSLFPDTMEVQTNFDHVMDRTFMMGLSYAAGQVTYWLNGWSPLTRTLTWVEPVGGEFSIGAHDDIDGDFGGSLDDWLIGGGYVEDGGYDEDQWRSLWSYFRQTGRLDHPTLPMDLRYEARFLHPEDEDGVTRPTTWENKGSLGAAGDLTWTGAAEDTLDFTSDVNLLPG